MSYDDEKTELEELQEFLTPHWPVHSANADIDYYAYDLIYLVKYMSGDGHSFDDVALRAIEIVRNEIDSHNKSYDAPIIGNSSENSKED